MRTTAVTPVDHIGIIYRVSMADHQLLCDSEIPSCTVDGLFWQLRSTSFKIQANS
jgi:hypothetical protein